MGAHVIKARWWRRGGLWMGVLLVPLGLTWFEPGAPVWRVVLASTQLALALLLLVYGWRQGVEVDARGVRIRRLVRRRSVPWEEVAGFTPEDPPRLVTTDRTRLQLFDWAGDADRLHDALEDARSALADGEASRWPDPS